MSNPLNIRKTERIQLNPTDIALTIYVIFTIIAFYVSYKYASVMIRITGLFGAHTFIEMVINLAFGIAAILGWFFHSWSVNEFLFFGGLVLGVGLLLISEVALIITLLLKRKRGLAGKS
jgi:hypothetical protein